MSLERFLAKLIGGTAGCEISHGRLSKICALLGQKPSYSPLSTVR